MRSRLRGGRAAYTTDTLPLFTPNWQSELGIVLARRMLLLIDVIEATDATKEFA